MTVEENGPQLPKGWHANSFSPFIKEGCIPQNRPVKCDECDWEGFESQIVKGIYDCDDLSARLAPGSEVPVGECPRELSDASGVWGCQSFVYYTDVQIAYRKTPGVLDQIVEATS